MLSYNGRIAHQWDKQRDDEYYEYIDKVTFTIRKAYPVNEITLQFGITDKRTCDNLKQFVEGTTTNFEKWGSEGSISIVSNTAEKEFAFLVTYQGPWVKLTFSIDHAECHQAFRSLALDLEKYPHR